MDTGNNDFEVDLHIGELTEQRIIDHLTKLGFEVRKVDHTTHDYDLELYRLNSSTPIKIEIKSHKGVSSYGDAYNTFFMETLSAAGNRPEWYRDNTVKPDIFMHHNRHTDQVFMFNAHKLMTHVKARESYSARWITDGSKMGLTVAWNSSRAGYIKHFKLNNAP